MTAGQALAVEQRPLQVVAALPGREEAVADQVAGADPDLERLVGIDLVRRLVDQQRRVAVGGGDVTDVGDVTTADRNPSLLINQAPNQVNANQPFQIRVSTRNLVRDRFLAAGQGGYYLERALLNGQGLTRGHFHTACRMLNGTNAQDPAPVPAFFVATEDGGGGTAPDTVTVQVPGLPQKGIAQCAVWAGDASHRIPMMERANQTPAFDAVRITVN